MIQLIVYEAKSWKMVQIVPRLEDGAGAEGQGENMVTEVRLEDI